MNFKVLKSSVSFMVLLILAIQWSCFASPPSFQTKVHNPWDNKAELKNLVSDPCKYKSFSDIPEPVLKPVFREGSDLYEFQNIYSSGNLILAFKKWLISTPAFRMASSVEDFDIIKLQNNGIWNEGIYEVTFHQYPNRSYILKETAVIGEASRLIKLQNSRVGHPECWARRDIGLQRVATQQEIHFFPRIPKIHEAAFFISPTRKIHSKVKDPSRISSDLRYLILMEKARGKSLADLSNEAYHNSNSFNQFLAIFKLVGKSLGYFHYFHAKNIRAQFKDWMTWSHGDLNWNNIFFDTETNEITFLDNETMGGYRSERGYYFDFLQSFYFLIENSLSTSRLRPGYFRYYLSKLLDSIADKIRKGLESDSRFSDINYSYTIEPYEAVLIALKDQDIVKEIPKSAAFNQMIENFYIFRSGVQGYLEAFPDEEQKKQVCEYFRNNCRKTTLRFMSNYSRIFKSNYQFQPIQSFDQLEPELVSALRNLFPPCFLAFLDENRFY